MAAEKGEPNPQGEATKIVDTKALDVSDGEPTPAVSELTEQEETAARSADTDKPGKSFVKVIVLEHDIKVDKAFDHEPNKALVRQEAIQRGLWPTGPVKFKGIETNAIDGRSQDLTYTVPARPAHAVGDESEKPTVVGDQSDPSTASSSADTDSATNASKTATVPDPTNADTPSKTA